jgi:hypothetical protein
LTRLGHSLRIGRSSMTLLRRDSTFYPSPRLAMEAPTEKLAYVARTQPSRELVE